MTTRSSSRTDRATTSSR
ncbi:MAG TPA: hypothetical protein PKB06_08280, partial [Actinotalea sp.]|nr:hypothetical protein [Actinotalea sp.]